MPFFSSDCKMVSLVLAVMVCSSPQIRTAIFTSEGTVRSVG